ncbi:outer membrane protein assembly factor BamB [Rhodoferax lithotrophicus]|uniref:Outer membrane protein assembly factor BamB n=1 Tax=Rhodoferax lithotrophicus TaxID=2798804 RepID=A0ABM7MUE1_9BURK|nr:PQQ-binding-like beta-propeller repeat protein [Rhodoferax sp. MIZ03]BCO29814.1 outer membrane protein assembly factor BamB [Rhodoferax sp. MIZ03]
MLVVLTRWLTCALLLFVSACGGGGGGGSGAPSVAGLKFAPPQLVATTPVGTSAVVSVTATMDTSVITGALYVGVVDPGGMFTDVFDINPISNTVATVSFHTNTTTMVPGVHNGTLMVYLCKDYYCNSQYNGSPVSLPYSITVTASPTAVTLNPSSISLSTDIGVPVQAVLSGQVGFEAGAAPQFAVQDSAGIFNPTVSATLNSGSSYQFTITMGAVNVPGTYSGMVRLSVCTAVCNGLNEVSGSPVQIPYTVVVSAPVTPALTLNPSSISLTTSAGAPVQTVLSGLVGSQAGAAPQFAAQDSAGLFNPTVNATLISGSNYQFTITMGGANTPSTPGTYSGTVNLSVCATVCNGFNGVSGSPVKIPYTLTITAPVLLQPVLTASGLPEWETYQGNAAHTGFLPVTLNAGVFSARWSRDFGVPLSPATVANGKVFVSTPVYFGAATLYALSETNGSQVWAHNFGSVPALNPPATYGGRVFVATSGHADTFMWSFNADDGTQLFKAPFNAQWEHYLAPTLLDGDACFDGGYYGGMYCMYASSGATKWSVSLGQYDQWTPALDHTYAFAYTGGTFSAINRSNGTVAFSVADPAFNWNGYSINAAPVIASNNSVLVVNGTGKANHVIRYSISGRSESWRVGGNFLNDPVVAAGKFYLSNQSVNQLEARDEPTGTLQWAWQPPLGETVSSNNLILVNNLVFVGTSDATYAVDLTTHQTVWRVARSGTLALSSNRVLYIVSTAGRIDAYNLF